MSSLLYSYLHLELCCVNELKPFNNNVLMWYLCASTISYSSVCKINLFIPLLALLIVISKIDCLVA